MEKMPKIAPMIKQVLWKRIVTYILLAFDISAPFSKNCCEYKGGTGVVVGTTSEDDPPASSATLVLVSLWFFSKVMDREEEAEEKPGETRSPHAYLFTPSMPLPINYTLHPGHGIFYTEADLPNSWENPTHAHFSVHLSSILRPVFLNL